MKQTLSKYSLSFEEDEFIKNQKEGNTRWIATLSSGFTIFQDDGRLGTNDSSWLRLQKYVSETGDNIVGLSIQFRSNMYSLPAMKDGYFFVNGVLFSLGAKKTYKYMHIGYLENNQVYVKRIRVPEILLESEEIRTIEQCKLGLIINVSSNGTTNSQNNG